MVLEAGVVLGLDFWSCGGWWTWLGCSSSDATPADGLSSETVEMCKLCIHCRYSPSIFKKYVTFNHIMPRQLLADSCFVYKYTIAAAIFPSNDAVILTMVNSAS